MVCTGMIEYSEDVEQLVVYSKMLHISSRVMEYYIDFEYYYNRMYLSSNIMYVN